MDGEGGSRGLGGGRGGDLETEIYGIGREEPFFNGIGGFEDEDIDAVYYIIYQGLVVVSMDLAAVEVNIELTAGLYVRCSVSRVVSEVICSLMVA